MFMHSMPSGSCLTARHSPFDSALVVPVSGGDKSGRWGGVMVAHLYYARHSGEDCNSHDPLSVHLLDGPAADLQALGQLPLARSP